MTTRSSFAHVSSRLCRVFAGLLLGGVGLAVNAQVVTFNSVTNLLEVPYFFLDGAPFSAKLKREGDSRFSIQSYAAASAVTDATYVPNFNSATGKLTVPLVAVDGQAYSGVMHLDADNRLAVLSIGGSPLAGGSSGLISGAELRAELAYPQSGSTADVARSGPQGIYTSLLTTAFIDASNYMIASQSSAFYDFGPLIVNGNTWTLGPGSVTTFVSLASDTGSGTFSPRNNFLGKTGGAGSLDLSYDPANALAVSLSSLSGVWRVSFGSDGIMTINVNADGSFSGQIVKTVSGLPLTTCNLSGSITQKEAGSFKNMFSLLLLGSGGVCPIEPGGTYQGLGAILYQSAGNNVGNGYRRYLSFLAKTARGSTLSIPFTRP